MEEYKAILGAERYEISDIWNVRNSETWKVMKPFLAWKWYLYIKLPVDSGRKTFIIHRIVAKAFIPNPENKRTVNHIDGNKLNNAKWNLEWATDEEQWIHKCRVLRKKTAGFIIKRNSDGRIYHSCREASVDNNISAGTVSNSYRWKCKSKILFTKV